MDASPLSPRVVVADDHPLVRLSLCEDLVAAGFDVCGEAATGRDAVAMTLRERPDLCLIDVWMPEGDGIAAARQIRRSLPDTMVVLITAAPDGDGALAAARAGAVGYLPKDVSRRRLPQVLHAVIGGETSYPRRLLHPVLRAVQGAAGCSCT